MRNSRSTPEILALIDGTAARPRDVAAQMDTQSISIQLAGPQGKTAVPHLWEKRSVDGERRWLAVFAWQDDSYRVELDFPRGAVEILPPDAPGTRSATTAIGGTTGDRGAAPSRAPVPLVGLRRGNQPAAVRASLRGAPLGAPPTSTGSRPRTDAELSEIQSDPSDPAA